MLLQNSESSPFIKQVLKNEMMAASNIATSFNRPVILGDQCINVTNQRIALAFKDTIRDILNPFNGWSRLYADVSQAVTSSLPTGPNYLGASDFFDSKLLFNAPVSLLRYPLAFLIKAPLTGTVTLSTLLLASYLSSMDGASTSSGIDWSDFVSIVSVVPSELLMSTLIFAFELALLSRVFIVTILAERNDVLAESIVRECFKAVENGEGKSTVVAVLGMAHCNGIKKIITERKEG
jgi:pheromone shutdown protein TraB